MMTECNFDDDTDDDLEQFEHDDLLQSNDDEYRFVLLVRVGNELRIVALHRCSLTLFSS